MLKQILCCSLLIGQLYAGEHPRPPLPSELNAAEVSAAFVRRFPGVPTELPTIRKESSSSSVSDAPSVDQAPEVSEDSDRRKGPKFTAAEDAGIMQYVQAHPGRQNWKNCLEWLTEQGIIAPGARTAGQLKDKYHYDLKNRPEFAAVSHMENAPRFTAAEDAGIMQYVQDHPGRQNWAECLEWLTEQGIIAPGSRTAMQIKNKYNGSLKAVDERKKLAPNFAVEEDEALLQYVQDHPRKKQNWEECLKDLTEQGIIAPGARTAKQLMLRYNVYLKAADERKDYAPAFTTEENEALLQIVREHPKLSWEDTAKLFAEMMKDKSDIQRTAVQLSCRYNVYLKGADERGNKAPDFMAEEDEALVQIVQDNPKLGWEERANLFAEMMKGKSDVQRLARQLNVRYNRRLKAADERRNYAPKFTPEEDEALLQIVREHPKLSWEDTAKLFAEMMKDKSDVQRTAAQLSKRYSGGLKAADERKKIASDFTAKEDDVLVQIVQAHPELSWKERAKLFAGAGVSNQGVQRTAAQLRARYNKNLKGADERGKKSLKFTTAEDAGIVQYVREHPGRQNWDACLEWLTEQGIIAQGSRTAKQINTRYNRYLKTRLGDENYSESASEEEESL